MGDARDDQEQSIKASRWADTVAAIGPLTRDELLTRLRGLDESNGEDDHIAADQLLLAYINDEEVTREFARHNHWYG